MAAIPELPTNNGRQFRVKAAMAKPLSRLLGTLVGMSVLGCAALLGACRQGAPTTPTPEAGRKQPQSQPNDQVAQEQAGREQQDQARRTAELLQAAQKRGWREGHNATVACLHGERAQTDGNELRCEEQNYVEKNYRQTNND